jgi:peptidoglycan/LPS O-acetylase OafA/YrhL
VRYNSALDGPRAVSRLNNFSSLRLLFASAVIFSHSPSILTGMVALEPHLGRATLGELAVDGFFLISGYLITTSFDHDSNLGGFFRKRALRIYPAFIINMLLCLFVLAPLVTKKYQPSLLWLPHLLFLGGPRVDGGLFEGMPMPGLNGPVWTLAYEFRCYILVAILGCVLGLRRVRSAILGAAIVLLALSGLHFLPGSSGAVYVVLGSPSDGARLFGMFAAGMSFYLWRDRVVYDHRIAAVATLCFLAASLRAPVVAEMVIALCGGYLVFWAALKVPALLLSRFGDRTDLSFGIYLYAWPIQMSIAYALDKSINPWLLSCIALAGAAIAAHFSWSVVEKPAMSFAKGTRAVMPGWRRPNDSGLPCP